MTSIDDKATTVQLTLEDVSVTYAASRRTVQAVRGVSLRLEAGRSLGIVGESGSGKSTLGLAIMRLLPQAARLEGRILLGEEDLAALSERQMRKRRGSGVGLVMQDSLSALNPVFSIRSQLADTLRCHNGKASRAEARRQANAMLEEMGIPSDRLDLYPHQFSGGMRQRVMIAAALAARPHFLIADESTSDLDTVSQRQILDLLKRLQTERGIGLILISHDLGVINHVCDDVAVMYRGDLVEHGPTAQVLSRPKHWYTAGLVQISAKERDEQGYLKTLPSRSRAADQATADNGGAR